MFLARETKLGNRLVAVKVAPMVSAAEAEILGRLQHPNIVPVYSLRRDDATLLSLVCMPYVGRRELHDVLDQVKPAEGMPRSGRVILDAAGDLAQALSTGAGANALSGTGHLPRRCPLDRAEWRSAGVHP